MSGVVIDPNVLSIRGDNAFRSKATSAVIAMGTLFNPRPLSRGSSSGGGVGVRGGKGMGRLAMATIRRTGMSNTAASGKRDNSYKMKVVMSVQMASMLIEDPSCKVRSSFRSDFSASVTGNTSTVHQRSPCQQTSTNRSLRRSRRMWWWKAPP